MLVKWFKRVLGLEDTVPESPKDNAVFQIYIDKSGSMYRWKFLDGFKRVRGTGHQPFNSEEEALKDIEYIRRNAEDAEIEFRD